VSKNNRVLALVQSNVAPKNALTVVPEAWQITHRVFESELSTHRREIAISDWVRAVQEVVILSTGTG
jgi:hypothetical protein